MPADPALNETVKLMHSNRMSSFLQSIFASEGDSSVLQALTRRFATYAANNNLLERFERHTLCNDHPALPTWWAKNKNKLFLPSANQHEKIPNILLHPGAPEPQNFCLVLNGKCDYSLMLWGDSGLIYVSEKSDLRHAHLALGGGNIFIGDDVRATARFTINCRNQGSVSLDEDVLIGSDVLLMTDDCHAILDAVESRRINPYGGTINIKKHVWIADQVRIMGDSSIQSDCVVGAGAFIRKNFEQSGVILAGIPARIVRENITWDERDLPPASP
jgi:acetyltransferase-like isoleucine patch superfamily enzyme